MKAHNKQQMEEDRKNNNPDASRRDGNKQTSMPNATPVDLSTAALLDEDNLITYREFMQALKSMKDDSLYKNLLPRTLSFEEVLKSKPEEEEYEVCDT